MMHNLSSFGRFPADTALVAYTHGGQVRLPGTLEWSWVRLTLRRTTST